MSNGKIKNLTVTSPTGSTVYALVIRSTDGNILDNSSGFFAPSPSNYGIPLIEASTVYSKEESRSVWVDGIYSIAYYIQAGSSPSVSVDTLIQTLSAIIQNDVLINSEVISGAVTHPACVSSSTEDVDVTDPETLTYDSIVCSEGDRILLRHQDDATENGIYIVGATDSSALVRATDMDISSEIQAGDIVYVESGTLYGDKVYVLVGIDPIILGTDDINFSGIVIGTLTSAHLYVGNGAGAAADVPVSGDLTLANTGAFTIANKAVTLAKMNDIESGTLIGRNTASTGVPESLTTIPAGIQDNITRLGTLVTKLVTGVGSTAGAMFNLPTSSADPTSPVEGDVWKTATELRMYLNGAKGTITFTPDP